MEAHLLTRLVMADTLILNADAQPLSILPISSLCWQDSVKILFLERVDIIQEYQDWIIRSPSTEMKVPSIMMLRDYVKVSKSIRFSRYNVFLRDNFSCQYCGEDYTEKHHDLTLDHVLPRSHGGKTNWMNVVAACSSCNTRKANYFEMKPKNLPKKPTYFELANKRRNFPVVIPDIAWNDYIQWQEDLIRVKKS